jgi:hypothetical protein
VDDELGLLDTRILDTDTLRFASKQPEKFRNGPPEFVPIPELVR